MAMRFVIMQESDRAGGERVVLEHDQERLRERLGILLKNTLSKSRRPFRGFKDEDIAEFAKQSFDSLVEDFKALTVRIV